MNAVVSTFKASENPVVRQKYPVTGRRWCTKEQSAFHGSTSGY